MLTARSAMVSRLHDADNVDPIHQACSPACFKRTLVLWFPIRVLRRNGRSISLSATRSTRPAAEQARNTSCWSPTPSGALRKIALAKEYAVDSANGGAGFRC